MKGKEVLELLSRMSPEELEMPFMLAVNYRDRLNATVAYEVEHIEVKEKFYSPYYSADRVPVDVSKVYEDLSQAIVVSNFEVEQY